MTNSGLWSVGSIATNHLGAIWEIYFKVVCIKRPQGRLFARGIHKVVVMWKLFHIVVWWALPCCNWSRWCLNCWYLIHEPEAISPCSVWLVDRPGNMGPRLHDTGPTYALWNHRGQQNTLVTRQNGCWDFADNLLKRIFLNENYS